VRRARIRDERLWLRALLFVVCYLAVIGATALLGAALWGRS